MMASETPVDESPNLDLLRSWAVLLVLADHTLRYLALVPEDSFFRQLGRSGVLLFFVHTALVLMLSLQRQAGFGYQHGYGVFMLRRCFRIYPAALVAIAFVCALRLPLGHFDLGAFLPARFDARTILSDAFLVQNLTGSESVLEPLWSLPFELQMYLVLPGLYWLCRTSRVLPKPLHGGCALAAWLLGAGLVEVIEKRWSTKLLVFVPCFLAGVVAYQLWGNRRRLPAVAWPLFLVLTTLSYLAHPGLHSGWLACLALGIGVAQCKELTFEPVRRACQLVARYSYGVYLTHGICIWFALDALATLPAVLRWSLFIALTVITPVALYHLVEAPLMRLGSRIVKRWAKRRTVAAEPRWVPVG
jgi:peptidoglycan/LPS O-acetylase OafA/YrhL